MNKEVSTEVLCERIENLSKQVSSLDSKVDGLDGKLERSDEKVNDKLEGMNKRITEWFRSTGKNNKVFGDWINEEFARKEKVVELEKKVDSLSSDHISHLQQEMIRLNTKVNTTSVINVGAVLVAILVQYLFR